MKSNKQRVIEIISTFSDETDLTEIKQINKILHIIMSHSQQAIFFISSIEDEFDIEINDEDINLDNILYFDKLLNLIISYKKKSIQSFHK